jgi:hypothetical protein
MRFANPGRSGPGTPRVAFLLDSPCDGTRSLIDRLFLEFLINLDYTRGRGMIDRREFLIASLGTVAAAAEAQTSGEPILTSRNPPDSKIPVLKARYAFSVSVFFKERVIVDSGRRRAYVPAIGGEIWGPRLQGRVVPYGGADYGSGGLVAHYLFEASDGAMIYITNYASILRLGEDGKQRPWAGDNPTARRAPNEPPKQSFEGGASVNSAATQRFRTLPVFDAPVGKHDWMNRTVFVGHGVRQMNPDHSIFTYYEVL